MTESRDGADGGEAVTRFRERLERLRSEGAYDRWRGGTVPWDEAAATAKFDGILWAALDPTANGPSLPGGELIAAIDRHVDPDGLSPAQRDRFRDVRAQFDAGQLDGRDRGDRLDPVYVALRWVAGIEHFDRWLEKYKHDGLYDRPENTPWADVPDARKVHALVGLAQQERPPGDYALAAIEREVNYARLPEGRRAALEDLRARIDADELEAHQPRDLADRANYALRLAEFEMRIEDYKRDGDPWQGETPIPWATLPQVRKLDLIVQEVGWQHLHFEPREYEIIVREVDLTRVPDGRRRGIESNREMLRIGPEEFERRRQEKHAPPNEAAAAFKQRIEEGLWKTCFTDGATIFADWSDLTPEAKLRELAGAMDWERVPESYFRTMVERELKVEDLQAEVRAALESPRANRDVFAAGCEGGGDPPPGKDDGPPAVRDTTRNLVESLMFDVWPRAGVIVDLGLKSQEHYEALYYPVREGDITAEQLDAALGDGEKLTALTRSARSNPHREIAFRTDWDDLRPVPETQVVSPADLAERAGPPSPRSSQGHIPRQKP